MSDAGQTRAGDQADIPAANDGYIHSRILLEPLALIFDAPPNPMRGTDAGGPILSAIAVPAGVSAKTTRPHGGLYLGFERRPRGQRIAIYRTRAASICLPLRPAREATT